MTIHVIVNGKTILEDKPQEDEMITLQLSKEAALAVMLVCGSVSSSMKGLRKYTSAVYDALYGQAGLRDAYSEEYIQGEVGFLK